MEIVKIGELAAGGVCALGSVIAFHRATKVNAQASFETRGVGMTHEQILYVASQGMLGMRERVINRMLIALFLAVFAAMSFTMFLR